jgi:hypothetical protein
LTPEYINNEFTEELLVLMFASRLKRIQRQARVVENAKNGGGYNMISSSQLISQMGGIKHTVVN